MSSRRRRGRTLQETSFTPSAVTGDGQPAASSGEAQPTTPPLLPRPKSPTRRQRGFKERVEVSTVLVGPQPAPQERRITSHTVKRTRTGVLEQEISSEPLQLDEASAKRVRWEKLTTSAEPLPDLLSGLSLGGQDNDPDYLAWSDFEAALPENETDPASDPATGKATPKV